MVYIIYKVNIFLVDLLQCQYYSLRYVLLKEKNMLLTMEHEAKKKVEIFPSPERIDKVEESMENLETVVRERNVAYHKLETGETGERPGRLETSRFGLNYYYRLDFCLIFQFKTI